jgi:putative polyhydroxyalkanoate system protein
MPDIRIHREHQLGLGKAREIAWKWAEEVEQGFDMACTVIEGDSADTVQFKRSGVSGELIVAADHFELQAKLGFLLGAFAKTIEKEILQNLDKQLAQAENQPVVKRAKAGARSAPQPTTQPIATKAKVSGKSKG